MTNLVFYWCPQTRATRIAWLLGELDIAHERVLIDIRDETARADPAFRAASPLGKVPAIRHGAVTVADSAAICLYLADMFPDARLAPPPGTPSRAAYYQWMVFAPGVIEPAMVERFGSMAPNRAVYGWGDFDSMIEALRRQLEGGPWILGDRFSAADVMVGSSVVFMRQFGLLPDHADLNAYADRCLARPAYAEAVRLDAEAAG